MLWREENLTASRAALRRLAPTPAERLARAGTERERSFGAAVEAFYADAPFPDRGRAYADAIRRRARAAPDDPEAAAFAAHSIMLAANFGGPGRDSLTREAIALAQRVAQANPDHPGAVHYLIHLYDTPGLAAQGFEFARACDRIAPAAEHALHMPSHIYLQLGLWEDVVHSNERAWAASRAEAGRADWHAFAWLQSGYLQQGRWAEARGLIDTALALTRDERSSGSYADARYIQARLEFQYAAETGRWERTVAIPRPSTGPMSDRERGFSLFARYWQAIDAAQRGDPGLPGIAAPFLAIADSVRAGTFGPEGSTVQASTRACDPVARRSGEG
ncbi:MAG: tetratricopeptide repeat protein [Gemmatimonadales bacterium]